jgi:hypothetical protein
MKLLRITLLTPFPPLYHDEFLGVQHQEGVHQRNAHLK